MKKPRGGKTAKAAPKAPPSPPAKRFDKIRMAVEACADRTGRIDPVAVWRAARGDPKHPLHGEFNWNVQQAAEHHWTETARRLIREVKLTVIFEDHKIVAPYYVADPQKPGSYSQTARVATRGDIAQRVLRDELDRIEAGIQRARALALSFELTAEFEKMLAIAMNIRALVDNTSDQPARTPRRASPEVRAQ